MKKLMIIVLGVVLLISSACSRPTGEPLTSTPEIVSTAAEKVPTLDELLSLGEKYLLELNYEQALVQFLKVIEIEPMNPRGYTGAAEAYVGLGDVENAVTIFEQGLIELTDNAEIRAFWDELLLSENETLRESTPAMILMPESEAIFEPLPEATPKPTAMPEPTSEPTSTPTAEPMLEPTPTFERPNESINNEPITYEEAERASLIIGRNYIYGWEHTPNIQAFPYYSETRDRFVAFEIHTVYENGFSTLVFKTRVDTETGEIFWNNGSPDEWRYVDNYQNIIRW